MKISLKNVGYEYLTFENNKNGIYNVSLEIASHKRIAIAGHTGSGKSTLLKLIKGLLKKQMGEINIDGNIEDIGYIFQYPEHQIFETTIFKDIFYGLKKLKLNEKEILKLMKELNSQGKTILHITHDRNDILEATEVIVLSKGEIKYQGNPYKIFEDDEFNPFLIKIKNILEKNNVKIDDKNINMEDLVRLVYENIS